MIEALVAQNSDASHGDYAEQEWELSWLMKFKI